MLAPLSNTRTPREREGGGGGGGERVGKEEEIKQVGAQHLCTLCIYYSVDAGIALL